MGIKLIKISSLYFLLGLFLGMFMGITHKMGYISVHTHVNLLGWVSLCLTGLVYRTFPVMERSVLGKIHFWLHNLGLIAMITGLLLNVWGQAGITGPFMAIGGSSVFIGVASFVVNLFRNVKI